jgi:selenocysteine lyase/cysteine desulfurase
MSSLYEQARHTIARELQADLSQYAVIFTGSGCTGALDKLARALLGSADSEQGRWLPWRQSALLPVVFIGPHEHHSNEVLWRERRCVVVVSVDGAGSMAAFAQ